MGVQSDPLDWSDPRHIRGYEGERTAWRFLERKGFAVLAHRFRMGRLEIDLVARRGCLVAFVEVKTRRSPTYGSPLEALTWRKKREIARVAQAWVDRSGAPGDTYRFDLIGVTVHSSGAHRVEHVPDAFRVGWR